MRTVATCTLAHFSTDVTTRVLMNTRLGMVSTIMFKPKMVDQYLSTFTGT